MGGAVSNPLSSSPLFLHLLSSIQLRCCTHLNSRNVGVLGKVLVLVQGVLGQLSLLLLDGELNQQEHNRLERGDGSASGALVGDVLMEQGQGRRGLVDPDQLVGALQDIFGLLMRRGRLSRGNKVSITAQRGICIGRGKDWQRDGRSHLPCPTHHTGQPPLRVDVNRARRFGGNE